MSYETEGVVKRLGLVELSGKLLAATQDLEVCVKTTLHPRAAMEESEKKPQPPLLPLEELRNNLDGALKQVLELRTFVVSELKEKL